MSVDEFMHWIAYLEITQEKQKQNGKTNSNRHPSKR